MQELRDANEKKLNELRAEELNLEATIKTHKRDLDVSALIHILMSFFCFCFVYS